MIVEDDRMIRGLIRLYLEKAGYRVVEAGDGEEAKAVFLDTQPCLVILDLMLPKLSGEEVCAWMKEQSPDEAAVIMLSAKTRTEDKVNGLQIGADGYLTKPFEPEELLAHVEAVLRRTGRFCQKLVYGGLCLKPLKGEVWLGDEQVRLTSHEFRLLHHFMKHPNLIFSRESLIDELYPDDSRAVMDRTIDAHIKKLREKIEEDPSSPSRIRTVRGMGYKFAVE